MEHIDPDRLYSLSQAARFIPSPHAGRPHVCLLTMYDWRDSGKIKVEARPSGKKKHYFIRGSEILRVLQGETCGPESPLLPLPQHRSATAKAQHAEAERYLKSQGL